MDYIVYRTLSKGLRQAIRFGIFGLIILEGANFIDVVLNKTTPLGFTVSTALACLFFRCNEGIWPALASSMFGTLYGFMLGSVYCLMAYSLNLTQQAKNVESIENCLKCHQRCSLDWYDGLCDNNDEQNK
ncbi:hypothetical protein ACOME3_008328 [Neoechinorhynchus agilis]